MTYREAYKRNREVLNSFYETRIIPQFIEISAFFAISVEVFIDLILMPWQIILWLVKFSPPEIVSAIWNMSGIVTLTYLHAATEDQLGLRVMVDNFGFPWLFFVGLFGFSVILVILGGKIKNYRRQAAIYAMTTTPTHLYFLAILLDSSRLGDISILPLWYLMGLSWFMLSSFRSYIDSQMRLELVKTELSDAKRQFSELKDDMVKLNNLANQGVQNEPIRSKHEFARENNQLNTIQS